MTIEQVLDEVRGFDGVLELAPQPGSEHPEISWGDHYFYWAPDGQVPTNRQPYATVVTKDYPDDTGSRLGGGRCRLNVHVGAERLAELVGPDEVPPDAVDAFFPHPLYGAYGWVSVVDPGPATTARAVELLRLAHADDERRVRRRDAGRQEP